MGDRFRRPPVAAVPCPAQVDLSTVAELREKQLIPVVELAALPGLDA